MDSRDILGEEADSLADIFGKGLRVLGTKPLDKVCLYADTKAEWMISSQGCFKQRFHVVTANN